MANEHVQPALIIGAGGSGVEVIRRFKRRFREVYPDTPYVQLLGVDTAPQEEELRDIPYLSDDEWLYAADFNMDFFVGENYLDKYPSIRAWWREYEGLSLRTIKAGAGMKRPVGRLALFVHFNKLVDRIQSQVREIFQSDVFNALPEHYRRSINVYIVSSTCGGTGTGMFLDLAYVVRHVVESVMPGITVRSRGLFFLPSVFIGTGKVPRQNRDRLLANAHGALTELDYAMSRNAKLPPLDYPSEPGISRSDPPFQTVYLVGNQTEEGALFRDFDVLMERCSVHLQIELASPLSEKGDARMDNVLAATAAKAPVEGKERAYSSFADDWIELPGARLHIRWIKMLCTRLVSQLNGEPSDGKDSKGRDAFTGLNSADGYGRLRGLQSTSGLNPYMPQVASEMEHFTDVGSDGRDTGDLIQRAQGLQAAANSDIDGNMELARVIESAVATTEAEIYESCGHLLKDGSLNDAKEFLSQVDEELRRWLSGARTEATPDAWVEDFVRSIQSSKPGLLSGKKRHVEQQRQLVLDSAEGARTAWGQALRAKSGVMIQDCVPQVLRSVAALKEVVTRLISAIGAAGVLVQQIDEPALPVGLATSAMTDDAIEEAFSSNSRDQRLTDEAVRGMPALLSLHPITVDAVASILWAESKRAVRGHAEEYLRSVSIPEHEIADRLGRLSPFAVYRAEWRANPAFHDIEQLRILGLPQSSAEREEAIRQQLAPEVRRDTETAVHRDEDRVVMTVQHHGFPLFALAESEDIAKAFGELSGSDQNLCFVEPNVDVRHWGYEPVGGSEARKYFCLAFALDLMKKVGPRFVFNEGRPGSQDIEFQEGKDVADALQLAQDSFLEDGYASRVQRVLRQHEQEDTTVLFEQLTRWVDQQQKRLESDDQAPQEFRECIEHVAAYARSIQPF